VVASAEGQLRDGVIWRYSRDGRKEWPIGRGPDGKSLLVRPVFVATDSAGSVYAISGESSLIQRFDVQRRVR